MANKINQKELLEEVQEKDIDDKEFKRIRNEREEKDDKDGSKKIKEPIELQNELFQVKGSLKKNITADYTLAHINKDEREFITENYQNAEFAKNIIMRYSEKGWRYQYDDEKADWVRDKHGNPKKVIIDAEERELIKKMAERIFEFFMVRPHMIAILGRNRTENFLVKLLGKASKEDEIEQPIGMMQPKGFLEKLKESLGGEEVVEEVD